MASEDYRLFETRMRGVWLASPRAGADEERIASDAMCPLADAFRISIVRRAASPALVSLWLAGDLSFRQLARIALVDAPAFSPEDETAQLSLAAAHVPSLRSSK